MISSSIYFFFKGLIYRKLALVAFIIILIFAFMALLSTFLPLKGKLEVNLEKAYRPPSFEHPFGTDHLGRDMFTQVILGARDVFTGGVIVATLAILIGTGIGMLAGYAGGRVDSLLMLITDSMILIPSIPVILILAVTFGSFDPITVYIIASLWMWMSIARGTRTRIMQLKGMEFIEALKCLGVSRFHLLYKEMLPHIGPYITVEFIMAVKNSIFIIIGLMFLGVAPWSPFNWGVIFYIASFEAGSIYMPKGIFHWGSVAFVLILLQWSLMQFSRYLEEVFSPRLKEYE